MAEDTARDRAIEAGAKAHWTETARQIRINGADNLGLTVPEWDDLSDETRGIDRRHMAHVYDAMAPLIRRDEDAIRADERRKTALEIADRIHWRFDHLVAPEHESMRVVAEWCEREAREIGGAS